jgi:hypothetical protein
MTQQRELASEADVDRLYPKKSIVEVLAALEELDAKILARRGGVPIPAEVIDEMLDEVRGRAGAGVEA